MAIGNMQYGANNNSGNDQTRLTSTAVSSTLHVESTGGGSDAIIGEARAQGHGVAGFSNGCAWVEGCTPGAGVYGENTGVGHGVRGTSPNGIGVGGYSNSRPGVDAVSTSDNAVTALSYQRNGVQGESRSRADSGVYGANMSRGGFGVAGRSNAPPGTFPLFFAPPGAAIFGENVAGGCAGLFNGSLIVNGPVIKPGGSFAIDHPVDAANKALYHSFVESPDMMNVYNGNVITDGDGNSTVKLPGYFEALNRDFRYQLTVVGGEFAQAIVAEEVRNNQFSIRTDSPNVMVSWQVTGIRQDAWANAHRIEVEIEKPDELRGRYLTPEEHGEPAASGIFYVEPPAADETRIYTGLEECE